MDLRDMLEDQRATVHESDELWIIFNVIYNVIIDLL